MLAKTQTAADRDLKRDRFPGTTVVGLFLSILSIVAAAGWPWGGRQDHALGLPVDRPGTVMIHRGRSVVDLHLSPDTAVKLLISNLGHSSQSASITIKAEPLSGWPHYRPVRLDSDLFASVGTTHGKSHDGSVPAESPKSRDLQCLHGSGEASPARFAGLDRNLNKSVVMKRSTAEFPRPNATRDFWLHVTAEPLEDSRGYQLIHGRLEVTRPTIQVYLDANLYRTDGCLSTVQKIALEIAEKLESSVLPAIGSRLGNIADIDNDGRLTVLITPWLSRLRGGATQVRGFVRSSDFHDDIASPFSNHADVLYLNSDLPSGTSLQTLLLHEVTHAALFSQGGAHKIVDRSGIQRVDGEAIHESVPNLPLKPFKPQEWDDWLNEGLAHLSERSGGGDWSNLDYRVARYWQQPATSPLIVGDYFRSGRWRDHGCRGATFLFLEWCEQQYANRKCGEFTTAVAAAGRPGVEAIEKVLGCDFDELYRAWTISVATQEATLRPSRIGRFGASGPRWLDWNVTRSVAQTLQVAGTATQFVELRADRPQWYRLSLNGDALQPWQVTVVNDSLSRPAVDLSAHWDAGDTATQSSVVVSMATPLPAEWQIDRVTCEEICEPHPRVWEWSAEKMHGSVTVGADSRRTVGRVAVLPLGNLKVDSESAVIKVRLKKSTGEIAWAWCDLPAARFGAPQPMRIATVPLP